MCLVRSGIIDGADNSHIEINTIFYLLEPLARGLFISKFLSKFSEKFKGVHFNNFFIISLL
jgi:hypothetical protein